MGDEHRMYSCFGTIQANEIETYGNDLKINTNTIIDGNLKLKGFLEEKNKREIIFDEQIDITSESNQDIKSGIKIDFKPLENEYSYKLLVIINDGEFINKTEFLYGKSICILWQCHNNYSVSLSISDDTLIIKLKPRNKADIKNSIYSIRIKGHLRAEGF
jgi:hypothetical protein